MLVEVKVGDTLHVGRVSNILPDLDCITVECDIPIGPEAFPASYAQPGGEACICGYVNGLWEFSYGRVIHCGQLKWFIVNFGCLPGYSGCPVFDKNGCLIGMTVGAQRIVSPSHRNSTQALRIEVLGALIEFYPPEPVDSYETCE
jgi:hypothetical protein